MVRAVPPCIDTRNDVQRDLDQAVRDVHEKLGNEIRGFVLIAHTDDLRDPTTALATEISPKELPDYIADAIDLRLFETGAYAENDN